MKPSDQIGNCLLRSPRSIHIEHNFLTLIMRQRRKQKRGVTDSNLQSTTVRSPNTCDVIIASAERLQTIEGRGACTLPKSAWSLSLGRLSVTPVLVSKLDGSLVVLLLISDKRSCYDLIAPKMKYLISGRKYLAATTDKCDARRYMRE